MLCALFSMFSGEKRHHQIETDGFFREAQWHGIDERASVCCIVRLITQPRGEPSLVIYALLNEKQIVCHICTNYVCSYIIYHHQQCCFNACLLGHQKKT